MHEYGEACPVSMASSVLCERWTLQIIREMLLGATRFSEFQKYLPKISPTLLNNRLRTLETQGIIMRKRVPEQKSYEYHLTSCGRALQPVIFEMGKWGMNWVYEGLDGLELNASSIVRDFAVAMDTKLLPSCDTVIQFNITDLDEECGKKYIHVHDGNAEVCDKNLGSEVDLYLTAPLRIFTEIWYGDTNVINAESGGQLKIVGSSVYTKSISKWLRSSQFAPENRNYTALSQESSE